VLSGLARLADIRPAVLRGLAKLANIHRAVLRGLAKLANIRQHSPNHLQSTRQTRRHSPNVIFEKNVTRLATFSRIWGEWPLLKKKPFKIKNISNEPKPDFVVVTSESLD
jgi:hypothetical protein